MTKVVIIISVLFVVGLTIYNFDGSFKDPDVTYEAELYSSGTLSVDFKYMEYASYKEIKLIKNKITTFKNDKKEFTYFTGYIPINPFYRWISNKTNNKYIF